MCGGTTTRHAIRAALLALGLLIAAQCALFVPAAAARRRARPGRPRIYRTSASASTVSSSGGVVTVTAKVRHVRACRLTAAPALAGLPRTVRCSRGKATFHVALPSDSSLHGVSYAFTLRASLGRRATQSHFTAQVAAGSKPWPGAGVLTDPINKEFLRETYFGTRSFWIQPWRSYMETLPASALTNAVGVNFNPSTFRLYQPLARLMHESGFKLARIGIDWPSLSYSNPSEFIPTIRAKIKQRLETLKEYGLRPLILLDAYSASPTPSEPITLATEEAAAKGATSVKLNPELTDIAAIVPGRTGFDDLAWGGKPDLLITAVNAKGVATLSAPLRAPLAAGEHEGSTLRYAPFEAPTLANGKPNPEFEETMEGWLKYVEAATKLALEVFPEGDFDFEIWNELSWGSQFLNYESYYGAEEREEVLERESEGGEEAAEQPEERETRRVEEREEKEAEEKTARERSEAEEKAERELREEVRASEEETRHNREARERETAEREARELKEHQENEVREAREKEEQEEREKEGAQKVRPAVAKALLERSVARIRQIAPAAVGITNGFASQTPFATPENAPPGLTAYSKHPYHGFREYPADARRGSLISINALGEKEHEHPEENRYAYVPTFDEIFPEYYLTALSTENLVRDVSPYTTKIYGASQGRYILGRGGTPVQTWITEYGLSPAKATPVGPDGVTELPDVTLTSRDREHFQTKALLRSLVSMVSVGISREYFFAATGNGDLGIVPEAWLSEAKSGAYPGAASAGETVNSIRNLVSHFQGPGPGATAQQLTLASIEQQNEHAQFSGDGTAAHPPLYDRDVLAVFPFESAPNRFVIPVYVMTRDLLTDYEPQQPESDVQRFDLPQENFRITLGGLPAGEPSVSFYDPITNSDAPAKFIEDTATGAEFEVAATDYPRLLQIEYR